MKRNNARARSLCRYCNLTKGVPTKLRKHQGLGKAVRSGGPPRKVAASRLDARPKLLDAAVRWPAEHRR